MNLRRKRLIAASATAPDVRAHVRGIEHDLARADVRDRKMADAARRQYAKFARAYHRARW